MATFPQDPTFSDLGNIAQQAFKASPRAYEKYLMSQNPSLQLEMSPVAEMASSSPITGAFKQILPHKAKMLKLATDCQCSSRDLKRGSEHRTRRHVCRAEEGTRSSGLDRSCVGSRWRSAKSQWPVAKRLTLALATTALKPPRWQASSGLTWPQMACGTSGGSLMRLRQLLRLRCSRVRDAAKKNANLSGLHERER